MDENNEIQETEQKDLKEVGLMEIAEMGESSEGIPQEFVDQVLSDDTIDNMKAFTVILAKKQFVRVVKLIDSLGQMEDKLIDKISDKKSVDELEPGQIAYMIRTLQGSLDRAMNLIQSIIDDEEYYQFIFDNSTTVNQNVMEVVGDKSSRDKLRDVATRMISAMDQAEPKDVSNEEE